MHSGALAYKHIVLCLLWYIIIFTMVYYYMYLLYLPWYIYGGVQKFYSISSESECRWPNDAIGKRRNVFCSKQEGFGSVCSCKEPASISFNTEEVRRI